VITKIIFEVTCSQRNLDQAIVKALQAEIKVL
jgi:hypothetical protein